LLRIVVGEEAAFIGDPIDVGRSITHHAVAKFADIPDADIVAPEYQNIGLFRWHYKVVSPSK
jgi:hypothetical protein